MSARDYALYSVRLRLFFFQLRPERGGWLSPGRRFYTFETAGHKSENNRKKRKVGRKRYEARSRGRSSPDTLALSLRTRPYDRADYCLD